MDKITDSIKKHTPIKRLRLFLLHFVVLISIFFAQKISAQETAIADNSDAVQAGKKLFNANCAACHKLNKRAVGPALKGVSAKYDKEWLYAWIKNSTAMVKSGDAQAVAIYEEYNGSVMTSFPQLSNLDIDNILAYTDYVPPAPVAAATVPVAASSQEFGVGVSNTLILIALSLVFVILVTMLFLVQRTLMRIAKLSGVEIKPDPKPKPDKKKDYEKNKIELFPKNGEVHFNSKGHYVTAKKIYEYMIKNSLIN